MFPCGEGAGSGKVSRVLPSVLSGVRDLRSALVVGYSWLIAGWLLVTDWWPSVADWPSHSSRGLLSLADLFGRAGGLATITVVALLVGELWITTVSWAVVSLGRQQLRRIDPDHLERSVRSRYILFSPLTRHSLRRLARHTEASFSAAERLDPGFAQALRNRTARVFSESLLSAPRLIVARPELYEEHLRSRQEGEFLFALILPLPVLVLALLPALDADAVAWAGALVTLAVLEVLLLLQAARQLKLALSGLAHFVADGVITTPSLGDPTIRRGEDG